VAGYPLTPDLDSKALSVCDAITTLGTDNPLATINLDAFRAQFIDEDQCYILETMDHALEMKRAAEKRKAEAKKRKVDEMDSGN
jgi:hypothetical protein